MVPPHVLILGDLHLGPVAPAGAEAAVVELLERYPRGELVCLGDLFDLSADVRGLSPVESVGSHFGRFARLTQALRMHLSSGGSITLVVGNHDAELYSTGVKEFLANYLDVPNPDAFAIAPWWIRRGPIHLEHGHVWDEDNAPIHPLALPDHDCEPLGVALTRRVLAPTGAYQFAHAHHTTPLKGLLRAFYELGWRAPDIILRYFAVGARIFWQAACNAHEPTEREGARAIDAYAKALGIAPAVVARLIELRPVPRHLDPTALFARLYFDRAAAAVLSAASIAAAIHGREPTYVGITAAGLSYLACSKGDRSHRYSGSLLKRLETAAIGIRPIVEARTVVFGHTHVPHAQAGYVNTGAFGYPSERGRPFLLLEHDHQLTRGWLGRELELEAAESFAATE